MKQTTALLSAFALGVAATPAQAAEFLITYTGTVTEGVDLTGAFGAPGDLTGKAFTAIYKLNTGLLSVVSDDGSTAQIFGGTEYQNPPFPVSPLSATLTIDGITHAISGIYSGKAFQSNGPSDQISHFASHNVGTELHGERLAIENFIWSGVNNIVDTHDYTTPLNYTLQPGDFGGGGFILHHRDNGNFVRYAIGDFRTETVIIAAVTTDAVPEPATWAMMIVGFGLVGGAMRRKRTVTAGIAWA